MLDHNNPQRTEASEGAREVRGKQRVWAGRGHEDYDWENVGLVYVHVGSGCVWRRDLLGSWMFAVVMGM
jgi:hypothetical protein